MTETGNINTTIDSIPPEEGTGYHKQAPPDDPTRSSRNSLTYSMMLRDDDSSPKKLAFLIALVIHILLITITFPKFTKPILNTEKKEVVYVSRWQPPPPPKVERPKQVIQQDLKARKVPVPDPTPDEPEPIREPEPEPEPIPIPPDVEIVIGAPEPPPLQEGPVRAGFGGVTYPILIESTKMLPEYPELARKAKVKGMVILECVVTKTGSVDRCTVLRSPGSTLGFDEKALMAVTHWRYKPGVMNGKPVDVVFTITVDFVLENS